MIEELTSKELFKEEVSPEIQKLLDTYQYPWQVLDHIGEFIMEIGETLSSDEYNKIGDNIWISKSARVEPTALIKGPCIIESGVEVRHCAFIRGNAYVGKNSVVGNSVELKNSILINQAEVPHYNYVGDSILGYRAHLGAGAITSNIKADRNDVTIRYNNEIVETHRRKCGAMIGDHVEIGCNCVLNPGTIIGRNTNVYPLNSIRGYIYSNSIYKECGNIIKKSRRSGIRLVVANKEAIDEEVSNEFIRLINDNPNCNLGLATGSTPEGVYSKLVEAYNNNTVSFKNVKTFNLDEYLGIDENNINSYRYFMNHHLFNYVDINKANTNIPSINPDSSNNYVKYDAKIEEAGGIDLQILGIGSNGHIAFNEPDTSFNSNTHIVNLKESTIKDNSRFFNSINEVPKQAITMGLSSIMKAKRIVLLAYGKNKAQAIKKLFSENPQESLPASILRNHKNVTVYCDKEAAGLLDTSLFTDNE